ncbi:MAG TPA: hypothetical protein DEU72_08760 [Desulfomicrobiaceae bacterium]|jgi:hypothetical protein|nr:hypothetical protein [Desulfomicrobiaceae bacterium]
MSEVTTKASLTPARRRLLELMQEINFGRIEGLAVRGGEPVLDPPPRVVREIKFGGENGPRRELGSDDFALKAQAVEFFTHLSRLGDGTVEILEIKHGLPFRMSVEEAVRA